MREILTMSQLQEVTSLNLAIGNFEEDLFKTELEFNDFFEGIVKINFTLNASTDTIVLHADNSLKIKSPVQIFDFTNTLAANVSNFTYGENQLLLVHV